MKLKELPKSIYHTFRLASIPMKRLLHAKKDSIPVIVSFTSIPSRLEKVHIVVRCILDQSVLPKKIILWLHESMRTEIPDKLARLQGELFEIRYTHLHCSHKKLIHTVKAFPGSVIVTCDDDFIYDSKWLENLYYEHLDYPNYVIANHIRTISFDPERKLLPYKKWVYKAGLHENSPWLLPIGGKGVLYPPNAFDALYDDEKLFLTLAPKADDLWFKAMEWLNGTPARLSLRPVSEPIPIMGTQTISLKNENVDNDKNRDQWLALQDYFGFEKS